MAKAQAYAGYVMSFYGDVQNLTYMSADYLNLYLQIGIKYSGKEGDANLNNEEKTNMQVAIQSLRRMVFAINTKFNALEDVLENKDAKNIKALKTAYDKLMKATVPTQEHVETYVTGINKAMMKGISGETLSIMADFLDKVDSPESGEGAGTP
ncbi:MAG: hypothetical protein V3U92_19605 [Cellulophaga sp.]